MIGACSGFGQQWTAATLNREKGKQAALAAPATLAKCSMAFPEAVGAGVHAGREL
jgi:hypothetical protein